jgi:hypothetical protein
MRHVIVSLLVVVGLLSIGLSAAFFDREEERQIQTKIQQIQADIDEIKQVQGWQAARMGDISKQASRVRP